MKLSFLFIVANLFQLLCPGQKPNSGTYIFKYCDFEYNNCYGACKVVVKGDSIIVYATKELEQRRTYTKEGDIIDQGIILKHNSGKWIIGKTTDDKYAKQIGIDGPAILDFKKKQYWTF